jgi:hypothetical protein
MEQNHHLFLDLGVNWLKWWWWVLKNKSNLLGNFQITFYKIIKQLQALQEWFSVMCFELGKQNILNTFGYI